MDDPAIAAITKIVAHGVHELHRTVPGPSLIGKIKENIATRRPIRAKQVLIEDFCTSEDIPIPPSPPEWRLSVLDAIVITKQRRPVKQVRAGIVGGCTVRGAKGPRSQGSLDSSPPPCRGKSEALFDGADKEPVA